MADDLPDAPWAGGGSSLPDAPWVAPKRAVATQEAVGRGLVNSATFGLSPAIAGLGEASGNPKGELLYPNYEGEQGHGVLDTLTGGARLIHEKLIQPMLGQNPGGLAGQITGDQSGEATKAYHRGRKAALEDERLAQEQHPVAYLTGQLAGALTTPGFGAARGATTMARIGSGARAGTIAGGLYGTGEAISHGEGAGDTALSALRGAGTGAAFGTAGAGALEALRPVGAKIASVVRGMRNPDEEASRRVAHAIATDFERAGPSLGPEEIAASNAAGLPRSLVDAGDERTRALARSAANTSPEARAALTEMTQERFEQQAPRVAGFIRQITGGGNAAGDLEAIQNAARRANRPAYARAYQEGEGGIWHEGMEQLLQSPAVQQAARDAAKTGANKAAAEGFKPPRNPFQWAEDGTFTLARDAQGNRAVPTLQFWDAVKQNLDDKIGAAKRAGENGAARDLTALNTQLKAHLDEAVPSYADARRGAASFFGAENALDAGHKFAQSTLTGPKAQLDAQRAFQRFTPAERMLFARGYTSNLADRIERMGDNRNVLNATFVNNGPARDRTLMALGPQNARQLEALFRAERIVDRARTNLGNSSTARQLAEMGLAGGATAGAEGLLHQDFNPAHIITAAVTTGLARRGAQVIDQRVARRVGEMLASNDPAVLARGVQLAARTPVVFNALRQATSGLGRGATDVAQELGNRPEKPQIRPPGFQRGGRVNAQNIDPTPTDAQKEAGNYAKDHVRVHGLDITVENAKGSKRQGVDKDGKPWSVTMPAAYGYIKGTVGKDRDHVDVYLGHQPRIPRVYVVDQLNAETGKFDEHKCFIGFPSKAAVINIYRKAFSDGRAGERLGHLAEMSIEAFKHWLGNGDTTKPVGRQNRARGGRIKSFADGGAPEDDDVPYSQRPRVQIDAPVLTGDVAGATRRLNAIGLGDRLPAIAGGEPGERAADAVIADTIQPGRDLGGTLQRASQGLPTAPMDYLGPFAMAGANVLPGPKGMGAAVKATEAVAPQAETAAAKMIRAYHGSPHDFERFDISRIGTGEGAQAYGHGLYFAENPKVAETYKYVHGGGMPAPDAIVYQGNELSGISGTGRATLRPAGAPEPLDADGLRGFPSGGTGATVQNFGLGATPAKLKDAFHHYSDDQIAALQSLVTTRGDGPKAAALLTAKGKASAAKIAEETAGDFSVSKMNDPQGSKMYEVGINADPDHFLHWDKPLSEQSQKVQDAVASVLGRKSNGSGEGVYRSLQNEIDKQAVLAGRPNTSAASAMGDVSQKLREAGIPGIKYADAGSRYPEALTQNLASERNILQRLLGESEYPERAADIEKTRAYISDFERQIAEFRPTHNYVVFDDKTISILKKYGLAGLGIPGIGAAATSRSDTGLKHGGAVRDPALSTAYRIRRRKALA